VLNRGTSEDQDFTLLKLFYVLVLSSKQLVPTLFGFSRSHRNTDWYLFPSMPSVMAGLTMTTKL